MGKRRHRISLTIRFAIGAGAIAAALAAAFGSPRKAPVPPTLGECLDRPRQGYATPALRRRMRQCAAFLVPRAPPPASGLHTADRIDPRD